jgi:hypothetical protein
LHDPEPDVRGVEHKVVDPTVKATDPVGVPLPLVTVVEYATEVPKVVLVGRTEAVVVVLAGGMG